MRYALMVFLIFILANCKQKDHYVDQANLKCYSGGVVIFETTTAPYKIHHPSKNGDVWAIDTDKGRLELTGSCVYRTL